MTKHTPAISMKCRVCGFDLAEFASVFKALKDMVAQVEALNAQGAFEGDYQRALAVIAKAEGRE